MYSYRADDFVNARQVSGLRGEKTKNSCYPETLIVGLVQLDLWKKIEFQALFYEGSVNSFHPRTE